MNRKYFLIKNKEKIGPYSKDQLADMNLSRSTMVWVYGMSNWEKLSEVPALKDLLAKIPPEIKNVEKLITLRSKIVRKRKVINMLR